jgi:chitodextrinase
MRTRRTAALLTAALAVLALVLPNAIAASTKVQLVGTLELLHGEDVAGTAIYDYHLNTGHERVKLKFHGAAPDGFFNGATVRVNGTREGGALVADGGATSTGVLASAPTWSGPRKLAVILINFTNNATKPYTRSLANAVMFTNTNSVRAYYYEQSHGAVALQGTTFDWVTIPYANTTCQPQAWEAAAKAIFSARGTDLSSYTNFMYMFPWTPSCGWLGLGYLPGNTTWINGAPNLRTPAHELGHNFGVHHASSLRCTSNGVHVALSSTCSRSEYGDPFTTMGASSRRHDDNLALVQMGYLPTSATRTITVSGSYTLTQASASSGVRILGIPRGDGTWFYLEYRRPYGTSFDNFSSTDPAVNGVSIRLAQGWTTITQTLLIDTRPATTTFADAPLTLGRSFRDYLTGTTISVTRVGSTSATVTIKVPADSIAPTAPGGVTAHSTSASEIDLAWTAGADNRAVAGYRITRAGAVIATTNASTFKFADTGLVDGTAYAYDIQTVDASGNVSPAVEVSATTDRIDRAPSAPGSLALALTATSAHLTWAPATDDAGVARYEVRRSGALIGTVTGLGFMDSGLAPGSTYTWSVRAIDTASQPGPDANVTGTTDAIDASAPTTPTATIAAVNARWADVSWTPAMDNIGVTSYEVFQDGHLYAVVGGDTLVARVPSTGRYSITAVDAQGNRSEASAEVGL